MRERLENDDARFLAEDKTVAVAVDGREAWPGVSFRRESARSWSKPPMPSSVIAALLHREHHSASPRRIVSKASPIASAPVEQATRRRSPDAAAPARILTERAESTTISARATG